MKISFLLIDNIFMHTTGNHLNFRDADFQTQANILFEEIYPGLFRTLAALQEKIKADADIIVNKAEMLALINKVYTEIDEVYRKEKLVLFPHLKKLQEEGRELSNCKPLLNIRNQHAAIISMAKTITGLLQQQEEQGNIAAHIKSFDYFELDLTNIFSMKEAAVCTRFLKSDSIYFSM